MLTQTNFMDRDLIASCIYLNETKAAEANANECVPQILAGA